MKALNILSLALALTWVALIVAIPSFAILGYLDLTLAALFFSVVFGTLAVTLNEITREVGT